MASIIDTVMEKVTGTTDLNDRTIANDMLAGSKGAAQAYLTATLESATPELRALYSTSLDQIVDGHASLTNLAINKNWYKPYDMPDHQLAEAVKQSENVLDINR